MAVAAATVAELLDRVEPLPIETDVLAIVDRCLDDDQDWLVLVDAAGRPVRLVERAALLRSEPFEHGPASVPVAHSIEAAARRALARAPVERLRPLVGCDADGRYAGLLRMERLLAVLAG